MNLEQKNFIANLKYYRKLNSFSQQKLAELCDVSNGTIGNIESGVTKPSFDLIITISQVLSITPEKLFAKEKNTEFIFTDRQIDILSNVLKKELSENLSISIDTVINSIRKNIDFFDS